MTKPRFITPNMSPFEKFQPGDHVAHMTRGDGEVIGHEGGCVVVRFMDWPQYPARYDANWFSINSRLLFHRNTKPSN